MKFVVPILSLRKTVEAFLQRVKQLEDYIKSQGLPVPAMYPESSTLLSQLSVLYAPRPLKAASPAQSIVSASFSKPQQFPPQCPITTPDFHSGQTPDASRGNDSPSFGAAQQPMWASLMTIPSNNSIEVSMDMTAYHDFSEPALPVNNCFDVDWVWNHSLGPHIGTPDVEYTLQDQKQLDPMLRLAPELPHGSLDPTPSAALTDDDDDNSSDDEDHSAVTYQLSARLGSLLATENGEHHFYGATSNFNLVRGKFASSPYTKPSDRSRQAQARLQAAGLDQPVCKDHINRLLDLFFTWHNPSLYIVDREIFNEARKRYEAGDKDTPFFSTFLLNTMCAVGAAFDTRIHTDLPTPLSELFASRAKTLLDIEMERPRIATVQALSILSSHEAALTRDSQGWLFSGMAIRLAIDFGLHSSVKPFVEAGSMSVEEARGRSVAFWGAFTTDRMWGLYLGRPFHNILQAATVETPIHLSESKERHRTKDTSGVTEPNNKKAFLQELVVEHWIQLSIIMSSLEGSLYFHADASKNELQKLAADTWQQLLTWRRNLPADLDLNLDGPMPNDCPSHVLILHMLFEYLAIVLHRPFVAKNYIQPVPRVGQGPQHAREMCVRAASRIATLLAWYEQRFSLCRINIHVVQMTFGAALILVYATVSEHDAGAHRQLAGHLEVCCHALAELGATFANATRTLDVLLQIKRAWQARLVAASAGSKRRGGSVPRAQVRRKEAKT
ncbi:Nitrogen assimilation transcription factor nit-4 [Colletotrichum trifolii]|uniref:Nitrogen assimilation transcription factor nit-4 n=1 Tax=Colletotrichum trifolii TaxID=5466 RepID=A0A4R8RRS2_COLTR|nr:Nitrogen assimilation transcription factor nit-4 [Colletotrichum trifolii]